jgi:hypothetical protein
MNDRVKVAITNALETSICHVMAALDDPGLTPDAAKLIRTGIDYIEVALSKMEKLP